MLLNRVEVAFFTMWLAWTGPRALAPFTHTGWNTCTASLAPLALKDLLNATQKFKSLKEVCHLTKSVGHTQSTLIGLSWHIKNLMENSTSLS